MSKTEEKAAEKKPGIGDAAKAAIRAGQTNDEALATVKAKFPDAKTSMSSINWYRNKLRQDGENIPTARELKKPADKPAKAAKAAKAKDPLD